MANDYANLPVVFLEYDVDKAPWSRNGRFWAAHGSGTVTLPEIMVDSGNQITHGYEDFYNVYKAMVDTALARPAQADITAAWQRVGDKVRFDVRLTNLSLVALSSSSNLAAVHAIVYEDAHAADTNRFVRAAVFADITSSLAPGATASFVLETADLTGVNWDKLHFIALADYCPGGTFGPFDMLQAASALVKRVYLPVALR